MQSRQLRVFISRALPTRSPKCKAVSTGSGWKPGRNMEALAPGVTAQLGRRLLTALLNVGSSWRVKSSFFGWLTFPSPKAICELHPTWLENHPVKPGETILKDILAVLAASLRLCKPEGLRRSLWSLIWKRADDYTKWPARRGSGPVQRTLLKGPDLQALVLPPPRHVACRKMPTPWGLTFLSISGCSGRAVRVHETVDGNGQHCKGNSCGEHGPRYFKWPR